jgi:hypothetical protein
VGQHVEPHDRWDNDRTAFDATAVGSIKPDPFFSLPQAAGETDSRDWMGPGSELRFRGPVTRAWIRIDRGGEDYRAEATKASDPSSRVALNRLLMLAPGRGATAAAEEAAARATRNSDREPEHIISSIWWRSGEIQASITQ